MIDIMVFSMDDFLQLSTFYIRFNKHQVVFNNQIKTMNHFQSKPRLAWKKEEDEALKYLRQDLKIQKWTKIAEKLNSLNQIQSRNHQQCRDRYVNFLQKNIQNKKWSRESFQKLIDLYVTYGNKWSEIANHFENINGLLIKNKFYSRLRKGLRNINFLIQIFLSDRWEKLHFNITFKLINCAANKFDFSEKCPLGKRIQQHITFVEEIVKKAFEISWFDKKELLKAFKSKKVENFDRENIDKLIQEINFVDENFDKKHSNRRLLKQKPLSSNPVQIKLGKSQKQVGQLNDRKLEKDMLKIDCAEYNQIAYLEKKQFIEIISINSFEKQSYIEGHKNQNELFRVFSESEECDARRDNAKKISNKYSGYRQHKLEDVRYQARYIAQSKFFNGFNFYETSDLKARQMEINPWKQKQNVKK